MWFFSGSMWNHGRNQQKIREISGKMISLIWETPCYCSCYISMYFKDIALILKFLLAYIVEGGGGCLNLVAACSIS